MMLPENKGLDFSQEDSKETTNRTAMEWSVQGVASDPSPA
jgi:hypothetical protein